MALAFFVIALIFWYGAVLVSHHELATFIGLMVRQITYELQLTLYALQYKLVMCFTTFQILYHYDLVMVQYRVFRQSEGWDSYYMNNQILVHLLAFKNQEPNDEDDVHQVESFCQRKNTLRTCKPKLSGDKKSGIRGFKHTASPQLLA
ncbi:hypothetical protein JOM56_008226 [Amanita muscaria]